MSDFDLVRTLNSVGKKIFVDYYAQFSDPDLTTGEIADLLPQEYTLNARRTRASKGRKICQEGLGRFALRIIASSDKVDPAAAQRARELLAEG
ncbi:MAG TPA: hypothetical protein VFR81_11535 [Longimicrobium sp.]|nr:hypothetical protein [Longimicrobium sp.]